MFCFVLFFLVCCFCCCSFVAVEEGGDGGDVDAVRNEGALHLEAALGAQVALEVGAVHALALAAVLHAQVELARFAGLPVRWRQRFSSEIDRWNDGTIAKFAFLYLERDRLQRQAEQHGRCHPHHRQPLIGAHFASFLKPNGFFDGQRNRKRFID